MTYGALPIRCPLTYFAKGSLAQNLKELKLGWISLLGASLDVVCDGDLLEDALILTEGQRWWAQAPL